MTLYRLEEGQAAISLGTLVRVMSVLGLESDLDGLARDDRLGRQLQDQALPTRRIRRKTSSKSKPVVPS
jgi:hypothetical protein